MQTCLLASQVLEAPINQRVVLFLRRFDLDRSVIQRDALGSIKRINIHQHGRRTGWNVDYVLWIQGRWSQWKATKGLHWLAPVTLDQHAEFDAWLESDASNNAGKPCDARCLCRLHPRA